MPRKTPPRFRPEQWPWLDPEEGWVTVRSEGWPWNISVRVAQVDGVPQIVDLRVEAIRLYEGSKSMGFSPFGIVEGAGPFTWVPDERHVLDPTITAEHLRRLPLRQLLESAVAARERPDADWLEPTLRERPPGGWGADHFRAVAEVYRQAPRAPLLAIAARWHVSRATAAKWTAEARRREFLGYPARPGMAGAGAAKSDSMMQLGIAIAGLELELSEMDAASQQVGEV